MMGIGRQNELEFENANLNEFNAELVQILKDWRATELDAMDEEFTARVDAAISKATP